VSWENLEGEQESSQHSGEAYRQQVKEYLEAGEFHAIGDEYAGTSDIVLDRPAQNEEKVFRVETKHTKLGRTEESFINELARQFIDFHRGDTEFEFHVYAADYAAQQKWKKIFHDRIRKEKAVRDYYERLCDDHSLSEDEAEQLEELEFEDFWRFLEKVAIKKAGYERLGQLIDDRESKERRKKKWEFYVRENDPVKKRGELIPNCVQVTDPPDHLWVMPSVARNHHDVRDENPSYLPVWFDGDEAYSLINPEEMQESLRKYVKADDASRHIFTEWMGSAGDDERRWGITLLNYQLLWRGAKRHERCRVVRHDRTHKLIFEVSDRFGTTQQTLQGEETDIRRKEEVNDYVALLDMGRAVAHRYAEPRVKQYDNEFYAFLPTGWLFTRHGYGEKVIEGDEADELHNELDKNNRERITNKRSQFRQWRTHFGVPEETQSGDEFADLNISSQSQRMRLVPLVFELPERPPKNAGERDILMRGNQVE